MIWENASVTSAFGAQDITLDFTGCTHYLASLKYYTVANNKTRYYILAAIGDTCIMSRKFGSSDSGLSIGNCYYKSVRLASNGTVNNDFLIPEKIYGLKL